MRKIIAIFLLTLSCNLFKEEEKKAPTVIDVKPTVIYVSGVGSYIEREGSQFGISFGDTLEKNDKIISKKNKIDVQIGDSVLRVFPNSDVVFNEGNIKNTRASLNVGKLAYTGKKLNKDQSVIISTPTMIAGVRGTSFVISEKSLKVIDGSVEVSTEKEDQVLSEMSAVSVKDDLFFKDLVKKDDIEEALSIVIPEPGVAEKDVVDLIETSKKTSESRAKEIISSSGVVLSKAQFRELFKKLETIRLQNGKKIKGSVLSQNKETLKALIETGETIEIPVSTVLEITY